MSQVDYEDKDGDILQVDTDILDLQRSEQVVAFRFEAGDTVTLKRGPVKKLIKQLQEFVDAVGEMPR